MLSDWELWACAARLIASRNGDAARFAEARAAALEAAGDAYGVVVWQAIGRRIEQLQREPRSSVIN